MRPLPPPPEKVSITRIFYWFVQFRLILGPFRGGGGVKPNFADKNFMDTQTFLKNCSEIAGGVRAGLLQDGGPQRFHQKRGNDMETFQGCNVQRPQWSSQVPTGWGITRPGYARDKLRRRNFWEGFSSWPQNTAKRGKRRILLAKTAAFWTAGQIVNNVLLCSPTLPHKWKVQLSIQTTPTFTIQSSRASALVFLCAAPLFSLSLYIFPLALAGFMSLGFGDNHSGEHNTIEFEICTPTLCKVMPLHLRIWPPEAHALEQCAWNERAVLSSRSRWLECESARACFEDLPACFENGCSFLLTIGSFLLAAELFCLQLCLGAFLLTIEPFYLQLSFFACSGKACLRSSSTDCKQRSSTVSKKAPTVSKKASPFENVLLHVCAICASNHETGEKRKAQGDVWGKVNNKRWQWPNVGRAKLKWWTNTGTQSEAKWWRDVNRIMKGHTTQTLPLWAHQCGQWVPNKSLYNYMSGGANLLPKFMLISLSGKVFHGIWHSNKENSSASWNAALSCPLRPSNFANWYLVLISFRSRSGADHSLEFSAGSFLFRFTGVHLVL